MAGCKYGKNPKGKVQMTCVWESRPCSLAQDNLMKSWHQTRFHPGGNHQVYLNARSILKRFYLWEKEWEHMSRRRAGGEGERILKQTPSRTWSPRRGLSPGPCDHYSSWIPGNTAQSTEPARCPCKVHLLEQNCQKDWSKQDPWLVHVRLFCRIREN